MSGLQDEDLGGQISGLLLSVCVFALFIVWLINTPPLIRYGVTGAVVLIIAFQAISSIRNKSRLQKIRVSQNKQHANSDKFEREISRD